MRWILRALLALVLLVVAAALGARFSDGPLAIVAGGPFRSGELVVGPEPDWAFVHDIREVELQLETPPRSRTTWIVDHAGKAYIPCGYMDSTWGRIWKQWPLQAERNGAALLRIGDRVYERQLVRIQSGPEVEAIVTELARKYLGGGPPPPGAVDAVASGSLWLFELAPRP
jgi:hypothetical protein